MSYPKRTSSTSDISLERVKQLFHYDPDTGVFINIFPRKKAALMGQAGYLRPDGYIEISFDYTRVSAHRLAWFYMYGVWPEDQLDHIDRNRSNNAIRNLRPATNKQNMENANVQRNNTSGFRGVSKAETKGKWCAYIKHNGVKISLGTFDSIEGALSARKAAERKYFTRAAVYE